MKHLHRLSSIHLFKNKNDDDDDTYMVLDWYNISDNTQSSDIGNTEKKMAQVHLNIEKVSNLDTELYGLKWVLLHFSLSRCHCIPAKKKTTNLFLA